MGVEQEERDMWQPFFLTIEVAFLSTMLSFVAGVLLAYFVWRRQHGIPVVFTFKAAVLAAVVVSFPLLYLRCERLLQQLTVTFWGRRGHLAYRSFMFF